MPHRETGNARCDEQSLCSALHASALAQLDAMQVHLHCRGRHLHTGIHEARKAARRFRAVLALGKAVSGKQSIAAGRTIRQVCKRLSTLRDAHVVAQLASGKQGCAEHTEVLKSLRHLLRERRDELTRMAMKVDPNFGRRRREVQHARDVFTAVDWAGLSEQDVLLALHRSADRMHRAERDAKAAPTTAMCHRWRRRVRRLRMQLQAVNAIAHDDRLPAKCRIQAKRVLEKGLHTMPGINDLIALGDALGASQDRQLLKRVVHRKLGSPLQESAMDAMRVRAMSNKRRVPPEVKKGDPRWRAFNRSSPAPGAATPESVI